MIFNTYKLSIKQSLTILLIAITVFLIGFSTYSILPINNINSTREKDMLTVPVSLNHKIPLENKNENLNLISNLVYANSTSSQLIKIAILSQRYQMLNHMNSNNYKIEVSIIEQKVLIYEDNKLIKSMICSTGIKNKDTPEGFFYTNGKGEYFFNSKYSQGAFYWVNFLNNIYLFHSVPVDIENNIITSESLKLGEKASHGCIRLSLEDSKWLYDTIPSYNTLVYIH